MTLFELADMLVTQARIGKAREQLQKALRFVRELGVSDGIARAEAALQRLDA